MGATTRRTSTGSSGITGSRRVPASYVEFRRMSIETDISDVLPGDPRPDARPLEEPQCARPRSRTWPSLIPGRPARRCFRGSARRCTRTTRASTRSRRSCAARRPPRSRTRCSRPCSSPISSARPSSRPSSATGAGGSCSSSITPLVRRELVAVRRRRAGHGRRRVLRVASTGRRARSPARRAIVAGDAGARPRRSASGIHTGECERVGEKLAGLAVNVGARVAAAAGAGEVLVSGTVRDLVAGSGLRVRGPRRARAEGRAGLVAAVAGGSVNA